MRSNLVFLWQLNVANDQRSATVTIRTASTAYRLHCECRCAVPDCVPALIKPCRQHACPADRHLLLVCSSFLFIVAQFVGLWGAVRHDHVVVSLARYDWHMIGMGRYAGDDRWWCLFCDKGAPAANWHACNCCCSLIVYICCLVAHKTCLPERRPLALFSLRRRIVELARFS